MEAGSQRDPARVSRADILVPQDPFTSHSLVPKHGSVERRAESGDAASGTTLPQLLIEAAIQSPESDAVVGTFGILCYGELLIRAQNIAVALRRHRVGPGALVGVTMEQSPVTITSIIGILLAGAAYVPLTSDLLHDKAALTRIHAGGMKVVLCDSSYGSTSCSTWRELGTVLDASRMEQDIMPASEETFLPAVSPDSTAAVLFRHAKGEDTVGVMISHRAIARLAFAKDIVAASAGETFLLHPSANGRAALLELWCCLLQGATMALAVDGPLSIDSLSLSIRQHGVTTLCLPVSVVHDFLDHDPRVFAPLHTLIIENDGRSVLLPQRLVQLLAACPELHVVSTYGTLETSGYATSFAAPADYEPQAAVPLGIPIEGMKAYILDRGNPVRPGNPETLPQWMKSDLPGVETPVSLEDKLHQVKPGELGELAFGGDGVSLGYLSDPAATASQFIQPLEVGSDQQSLIFLTGEQARVRSDGLLELHGRADRHARKLPAIVESPVRPATAFTPADVEVMLVGQQRVRDAVVTEQIDMHGTRRNVAYVQMEPPTAKTPSEREAQAILEDSMRSVLPPEAMPTVFYYVESIPRDSHGQLDKVQLQQRWKRASERSLYEDPSQQDILEQVRSIWARLLQRTPGYDEDFFEAGGSQVQMIRLHVELNRRFPGAITMANLSVLTTIRKIYEHLVSIGAQSSREKLVQRGA